MIYWAMKPTKKFNKFMNLIIDSVYDDFIDYESFMELYFGYDLKSDSRNYNEMFPESVMEGMLKTLKDVNSSDKVYHISQYYYFILYNFIEFKIDVIGDEIRFEGNDTYPEFNEFFDFKKMEFKKHFRMDYIEMYFHDLDFQTAPNTFLALSEEDKTKLRFGDELFGIINGMQPHPDEIKPIIVENPIW